VCFDTYLPGSGLLKNGALQDRALARARAGAVSLCATLLRCARSSARGDAGGGELAQLPASERFGWLVAPSSTIIQPSEVHTGLTAQPAATLDHLLRSLVT
jgi:hypothetical protein